jgi:hypothetical protein
MDVISTIGYLGGMSKLTHSIRWFGLIILPALTAGGCMVEQNLTLKSDLSGDWSLKGEAMPFAADAFDDLASLGGFENASALYDEAIVNSRADIAKRQDINSYRIDRTGPHSWRADVGFQDIELILGGAEMSGIAEVTRRGSISTLSLRFDRQRAAKLEELVPLMNNPAFSLFNPAGTAGIDEESYITGILGFTFGEDNIPAIRKSSVGMTVQLPGPVTSVTGGRQTGPQTVRFETPLSRLLVPDKGIDWSVTWNSGS